MAAAILLTVGAAGYWCVRRWVTLPLRKVTAESNSIASGDLTTRLNVHSDDELGRLSKSLARMVEALKNAIAHAHGASRTMLDQSHQLVTVAEQVASSSQAHSDAASGVAVSVEQMSVSISQVARHARDAQQISLNSGQTATQGGAVMESADRANAKRGGPVTAPVRRPDTLARLLTSCRRRLSFQAPLRHPP